MTKSAKKEIEKFQNSPKTLLIPPPQLSAERLQELRGTWAREVRELDGREFNDLEEAISSLVTTVITRLNGGESCEMALETKFLNDLLSTDPTIRSVLQRSLKIKSR